MKIAGSDILLDHIISAINHNTMPNPTTVEQLRRARLIAFGVDPEVLELDEGFRTTFNRCGYCHEIGHNILSCQARLLRFDRICINLLDATQHFRAKENRYELTLKLTRKISFQDLKVIDDLLSDAIFAVADNLIDERTKTTDELFQLGKKGKTIRLAAYFAYTNLPPVTEERLNKIRNHPKYYSPIVQAPVFSVGPNKHFLQGVKFANTFFFITEKNCPICLQKLSTNNATTLGCSHHVCVICAIKCIQSTTQRNCGLCRAQIKEVAILSDTKYAQICNKYIIMVNGI